MENPVKEFQKGVSLYLELIDKLLDILEDLLSPVKPLAALCKNPALRKAAPLIVLASAGICLSGLLVLLVRKLGGKEESK